MVVQAPVQLALEHRVQRLGKLLHDAAQQGDVPAPIVPQYSIATAQQACQLALAVDQRDRDAIDLRLHPDIAFALQPSGYGLLVGELADAGVRYRVGAVPRALASGESLWERPKQA